MHAAASLLVGFVAFQHLGFLVLEMFLWNTPTGHGVFGLTPEFAAESSALAANQGLYNGFLAAGLIWSLLRGRAGFALRVFFLSCVVVAGLFGGLTVSGSIVVIQAVPAAVAIALVLVARKPSPDPT